MQAILLQIYLHLLCKHTYKFLAFFFKRLILYSDQYTARSRYLKPESFRSMPFGVCFDCFIATGTYKALSCMADCIYTNTCSFQKLYGASAAIESFRAKCGNLEYRLSHYW